MWRWLAIAALVSACGGDDDPKVFLGDGEQFPRSIAVLGDAVYWEAHDFVYRASVDGVGIEVAFEEEWCSALVPEETWLWCVGPFFVRKLHPDTGEVELVVDLEDRATGGPHSAAIDDEYVYFDESNVVAPLLPRITRVPKAGGPQETVLEAPLEGLTRIALDDTHVYFSEEWPARVGRVPKAGGTAEILFSAEGELGPLAVRDGWVYVIDTGTRANRHADGNIARIPATGGAAEVIAPEQAYPFDLYTDDRGLVWASAGEDPGPPDQGGVWAYDWADETVRHLARSEIYPWVVTADPDHVFFVTIDGEAYRVAR